MNNAEKNRIAVEKINRLFMDGQITKQEATDQLKVIQKEINQKAKEIADKFGMKPRYVSVQVTYSHGAKLR